MKFLAVFVAVLAVAAAAPRRAHVWTVNELSEAIDNPSTNPALKPYLIEALNHLMDAIWSGSPITAIPVNTPVGAVEPVQVAGILPGGNVIAVAPGAVAEVAPVEPVQVAGILPGGNVITDVAPVAPGAVAEVAPISPVAPAPVAEAASGKPLVQLIINVNAQAQEAVAPAGVAEKPVGVAPVGVAENKPVEAAEKPVVVAPTPVSVIDVPEVVSPVGVIDTPQVVSPVVVVDKPQVVSPVIVVDQPAVVAPIAVGEPELPAAAVNPIDVISVSPPEFNPVDVISPVPAVEAGSNDGILV